MDKVGCSGLTYKILYDSVRIHIIKNGVVPCQFSFSSSAQFLKNQEDLDKTKELVKKSNVPIFVHANVCHNSSDPVPAYVEAIKNDLRVTNSIGGRGVVIHVGKHCNRCSVEEAINIMRSTISELLETATPECPLLIEVPAGQGTELCTTVEELSSFYLSFSQEQRKRFFICLDTQHSFGAGYFPMEYIQSLISLCGIDVLKLIHLNDSRVERGSHLDRHQAIGKGFIGYDKLNEVAVWAMKNNIPCVYE